MLHGDGGIAISYFIFDVLGCEGGSTMHLPYEERRQLLEALELNGPHWRTTATFDDAALFQVMVDRGLEGVLAKRLTDPYVPGGRSWIKTKNRATARFAQERRRGQKIGSSCFRSELRRRVKRSPGFIERSVTMSHPDVSGEWSIFQSGGLELHLKVIDDGGTLSGSARYEAEADESTDEAFVDFVTGLTRYVSVHSMEAHGTVNEAFFEFDIAWNNGARGRYTGAFQEDGTLAGTAIDLENIGAAKATWGTNRVFMLPVAEPAPEPMAPILLPIDLHPGIKQAPRGDLTRATDDGIKEAPRGDLM
jgi:hypothetical protein